MLMLCVYRDQTFKYMLRVWGSPIDALNLVKEIFLCIPQMLGFRIFKFLFTENPMWSYVILSASAVQQQIQLNK